MEVLLVHLEVLEVVLVCVLDAPLLRNHLLPHLLKGLPLEEFLDRLFQILESQNHNRDIVKTP